MLRPPRVAIRWITTILLPLVSSAAWSATDTKDGAPAPSARSFELQVDATDLDRRIFRVHERMPVAAGVQRVLLPQWIPGHHSPTGRASALAGLEVQAAGRPVVWRRDPLDMYAFEIEVPAGVDRIDLDFQLLSPVAKESGRIAMTPAMLNIQWNDLMLYPAADRDTDVTVRPSMRLPTGWRFATALQSTAPQDGVVSFAPVSVEMLIDSPVLAGRNFARTDLDPGAAAAGRPPVFLDVVADSPDEWVMPPEALAAHRSLVQQADRLFGARHYAHYDFLLSISGELGGIGLEHHQSSENGVERPYFVDWAKPGVGRDLLSHEYTHSWNGKFRRPADLATPNPNVPMQDSLLWVYEGQTQFWGKVLAARSGLWTRGDSIDAFASTAAWADARAGRQWRNLQDTTNAPVLGAQGRRDDWPDWQRGADYYDEMAMVWLEADMRIRDASGGKRSLDDFAAAFFGPRADRSAGDFRPVTYGFDDVVAALDAVQRGPWQAFLRERLDAHDGGPLSNGLRMAGWRLAWTTEPNSVDKERAMRRQYDDFVYSLGFDVSKDGHLIGVRWDSPAFKSGLVRSNQLVAVDGLAYTADRLRQAINGAKASPRSIELLVRDIDRYRTVSVEYTGGLRHPHLERIPGTEDRLAVLLAPKR